MGKSCLITMIYRQTTPVHTYFTEIQDLDVYSLIWKGLILVKNSPGKNSISKSTLTVCETHAFYNSETRPICRYIQV